MPVNIDEKDAARLASSSGPFTVHAYCDHEKVSTRHCEGRPSIESARYYLAECRLAVHGGADYVEILNEHELVVARYGKDE